MDGRYFFKLEKGEHKLFVSWASRIPKYLKERWKKEFINKVGG